MDWPDVTFPRRLVEGFANLGTMEVSGIFPVYDSVEPITIEQLLEHKPAVIAKAQQQDLSEDAQFLYDSCMQ